MVPLNWMQTLSKSRITAIRLMHYDAALMDAIQAMLKTPLNLPESGKDLAMRTMLVIHTSYCGVV